MTFLRTCGLILLAAAIAKAQARDIPNPAPPGSGQAFLVAGADGRVYLSWTESVGSARRLEVAVWDKGAWNLVGQVASGERWLVNWADSPSFLPLPGGAFAAHWLERTGADSYTFKVAQSAGRAADWKVIFAPKVKEGGESGFVSLVPLANGLGAAYLAPGSAPGKDGNALHFAEFSRSGALVSDKVIDPDACSCCRPSAALTDDGPVVAYRDHESSETRDISVVLFRNGKWSAPRNLHHDGWRINGCPINGPALAASGKRLATAWYTEADAFPRVFVAMSKDAGATFDAPVRVDDGAAIGRVAVVLLPDGGAVASWMERKALKVRRVDPDGKPGAVQTVSAVDAGRNTGFPKMALAGDKLLLTWTADRVQTVGMDLPPR